MKLPTIVFVFALSLTVRGASQPDAIWTNNHPLYCSDVKFSSNSQWLVSGSYNGPGQLWNATNGALIRSFPMPGDNMTAVALSPDGTRLAGGGSNGKRGLWRVSDGVAIVFDNTPIYGFGEIAYANNGATYVMAIDGGATLVNGTNGAGVQPQPLFELEGFPRNIQFSPDSTLVGASDGTTKLWRASDGELLLSEDYGPGAVAFTPDNKYFAYANPGGQTATFWDLQTNGPARVFPAWGPEADFSPDGQLLLLIRDDRLEFWRVADAQLLVRYEDVINPRSLDIAPDGKHFAYGDEVGAVVMARMPLWIHTVTREGNDITLAWQGGSGHYQVQARQTAGTGLWQNLSNPTTNTTFTHSCLSPMFYRVQSLPP